MLIRLATPLGLLVCSECILPDDHEHMFIYYRMILLVVPNYADVIISQEEPQYLEINGCALIRKKCLRTNTSSFVIRLSILFW